ncbi:MAG TPA: hypothetical protein VFW96_25100 [Thermomicrobiales bacterium]|nr:hypothetical protein [Thermomicrobiales bacterium]
MGRRGALRPRRAARLLAGEAERLLLDALVRRCKAAGLLKV